MGVEERNLEFKIRLGNIIKEKFDGNVSKFARAADVPISTIQSYIKRKKIATPSIDILEKLALAAGVKIGDLYPISDSTELVRGALVNSHEHVIPAHDKCSHVGVYELSQAYMETPESVGTICVSNIIYRPTMMVLRVRGDSMSPTISDGALVGMDKGDRQIVSGDIYVVRRSYEGAIIRRVYVNGDAIVLIPENKDHQVLTLKDVDPSKVDFILGKVKWVIQKL